MAMFPFALSAATVGALDTAGYVVGDMPKNVGIPRALFVNKPAGTAYTCSAGIRLTIKDAAGNILFSTPCEPILGTAAAVKRLEVGLTEQALTAATGVITLTCDGTISAGVGSPTVEFRAYFDDYPF